MGNTKAKYFNGKEEISINAFRKFGDTHYLDFYDIQLLAGRKLEESDTARELLINETLLKQLGFSQPGDAVGQLIEYNKQKLPVVGVIRDFHIQSLHSKIEPVIMANALGDFSCFNIRIASAEKGGEQLKATLEKIEQAWKKIYPDTPFKYEFLDDTIRNFYATEQKTLKLSSTAMGLAILPGRLDYELAEIEKLLLLNDLNLALSELLFDEKLLKHEAWFIELYEKHAKFSKNTIRQMLQTEVALKFCQVLENSGVFKANSDGDAGLHDFIQQLEHE